MLKMRGAWMISVVPAVSGYKVLVDAAMPGRREGRGKRE
jgi:hypothetical protein